MIRLIITTLILLSATFGFASNKNGYDEKYFTIKEIIIEKVIDNKKATIPAPDELPKPQEEPAPSQTPQQPEPPASPQPGNFQDTINNVNSVLDTIDKIVNLAQKIWEIIEKNQPVVDIKVNYANAIPYGIQHWTQLQGWSKPKVVKFSFAAKNMYGINVVKVKYQVHLTYGGNYRGKGKFLTGVTIEPISVETAWGYKVSLTAEVPDSTITNVGTHEDPIASMQVQLKWTIHTIIKDVQQKVIYYVDGTGKVEEIASPFKKSQDEIKIKVEPVKVDTEPINFNF